jgi:hypothetical protein
MSSVSEKEGMQALMMSIMDRVGMMAADKIPVPPGHVLISVGQTYSQEDYFAPDTSSRWCWGILKADLTDLLSGFISDWYRAFTSKF